MAGIDEDDFIIDNFHDIDILAGSIRELNIVTVIYHLSLLL
jgi:hypothetical protein